MNIKEVVNNSNIQNAFFNLYFRWLDEKAYEDIKQYAEAFEKAANDNGAQISNVEGTKRPFGFKFDKDGPKYHMSAKLQGSRAIMQVKRV